MDESSENHNVNVQDAKISYPVDELIKYLPDDNTFGHVVRYCTQIEDLHWSLTSNALPDI